MFQWLFSRRDPPHATLVRPRLYDPYVLRVAVPDGLGGWDEHELEEFDCNGRDAARRAAYDLAARVGEAWPLVARVRMPAWLKGVRRAVWASETPGRCEVRAYAAGRRSPAVVVRVGDAGLVPA